MYRILAGVFVEEASPQFLQAMRSPQMLASLAQMGVVFAADVLDAEPQALEDALACEYATLFASSGGFPPVESVRLTGRFKQDPHYEVLKIYQRLGFEVQRGRFEVFADQLGIELSFVAELLEQAAMALARDQQSVYKTLDKEVKRFWALHLGRWVRGYSSLITRAANHSFYREMARLLGGFAQEEIVAMGLSKLDDLDQGQLEVPKTEVKVEFNLDEPVCGGCTPSRPDGGAARVIPISPISAMQDLQL
ncbi:MAG: molecular chaperone TorD family protein [Burkholderiales bacterium]|nr:molecular chaperone TorD family protein [Burkholderiales bacterium]